MLHLRRSQPRNFGIVEPGAVYRSAKLSPRTLAALTRRYRLRTILDLGATTLEPDKEARVARAAAEHGVTRYALRLKGTGEGDPNEYVRALRILTRKDLHPVLVHCGAGAQRTGACIVFFRHIVQGRNLDAAYREALAFRHDGRRHPELRPYIDRWAEPIAIAFRTGKLIPYDGVTTRQDGRTPIDELPA